MTEHLHELPVILIFLGAMILASQPIRALCYQIRIPQMVGFILLGVIVGPNLGLAGSLEPILNHSVEILAEVGIVVLLFRIGLESNITRLVKQLRHAAIIWLPNVIVAGLTVFILIYFWPGMGLIPALFAGVAATATSVSVSVAVWEDERQLNSNTGALLLNVAVLDDVTAVVLLSMLFAVAPLLQSPDSGEILNQALSVGAIQLVKLFGFSVACYLFSRYIEIPLSNAFAHMNPEFGAVVFAGGAVFLIAATAGLLGFSVAIGALFAGLAFSNNRDEKQIESEFSMLLVIFGPFFFIAIGFSLEIGAILPVLGLGAALFLAATLGKLIGTSVPAAFIMPSGRATLLGFSMVPRAEIFLLIMLFGLKQGEWAVPQELYNAAVLTSLATCIFGPIVISMLLRQQIGKYSDSEA